jgi:hypothetical protein
MRIPGTSESNPSRLSPSAIGTQALAEQPFSIETLYNEISVFYSISSIRSVWVEFSNL